MGVRVGEVEEKLDMSKSGYTKEETERGEEVKARRAGCKRDIS